MGGVSRETVKLQMEAIQKFTSNFLVKQYIDKMLINDMLCILFVTTWTGLKKWMVD